MLLLFCWGCRIFSDQPPSDDSNNSIECAAIADAWRTIKPYPYVWGGESVEEGGFDCSGAIYHVQKRIGNPVPRTTAAKYYLMAAGEEKHWNEADCGDWIWWQFSPSRPYGHIGMHVELPHVWQSGSSTGPAEIEMLEDGYWDERFKATKGMNND